MRLFCVLAMMLLTAAVFGQPGGDTERTPFTEIRFDTPEPMILVGGEWYVWRGIDGITYDELAEFALEIARDRWQDRIGEDLVWLMREYGQEPGENVDLLVARAGGGKQTLLRDVPMTHENRSITGETLDDNLDLNRLLRERSAREGIFDRRQAFRELERVIRVVHSYASLKGVNVGALLDAELERIGGQAADRGDVLLAAQRVVCRLGDGHASVSGWQRAAPDGYLPVLLSEAEEGVVAYTPDRSGLMNEDYPYVTEIDGVPIDRWIEAASAYVTAGSDQMVRRRSLGVMRWVNLVRRELELPEDDQVSFTLSDGRGLESGVRVAVAEDRPLYGDWPRGETRVLESGIGYMRLASMQPSREFRLRMAREGLGSSETESAWMDALITEFDSLADCPALIIDVRGNGGGVREPTVALMQRIMDADSEPVVVNAARARISRRQDAGDTDGYLDNRMLYPEAWDGWSEEERSAIAHFRERFEPAWTPEGGSFSDWHYMVVSPSERSPQNPRPVVVLIDDGCFSATDIFAAAMGELPNVTLMGQATSGGSARSIGYDLEHLGVELRLGSMVSYQPSGELYDGVGVQPDVEVERVATDLIGETDRVLEEAERYLLESKK